MKEAPNLPPFYALLFPPLAVSGSPSLSGVSHGLEAEILLLTSHQKVSSSLVLRHNA